MKLFKELKEGESAQGSLIYYNFKGWRGWIGLVFPITWYRQTKHPNCWNLLTGYSCDQPTRKWFGIKIYLPRIIISENH